VIPSATHRRAAPAGAEESLARYLAETPPARALLEGARRVTEVRVDADYSYLATRMAGERWVAVGDAAAFLDPIFSTGVLLAMQGGLDAASAIDAGLRRGALPARAFARYERAVRRRYHHFRRFATGFYDPAFRDLWFTPRKESSVYGAIVSVLAGNWRPSLGTRLRIAAFFALVELRRLELRLWRGRRVS
jgi:flavin-dependent dehydrogenase